MIHRRKVFADILFANNQLQHLVEKKMRVQTFQESLRLAVERTEDIERLLGRKGRGGVAAL
jgi:predicted RNA-binding protein YlqC (UPF0109 family)